MNLQILEKITSYLNENIDLLCFSLSCKQFYYNKDKYLKFLNVNRFSRYTDELYNSTTIKYNSSYSNIIENAIEEWRCRNSTNKEVLFTTEGVFVCYITHNQTIIQKPTAPLLCTVDSSEIPRDVHTFYFFEFININVCNEFNDILFRNNIKTLWTQGCEYTISLDNGSRLSNTLKRVYIGKHLNIIDYLPTDLDVLGVSIEDPTVQLRTLPEGIKELEITYNHPIQVGILPKSLLSLIFRSSAQPLIVGALPNGLKHLVLNQYTLPIASGILPNSLESIKGIVMVSEETVNSIRSLTNLKALEIESNENSDYRFNLKDIPQSVRKFGTNLCNIFGEFPDNVTTIYLNNYNKYFKGFNNFKFSSTSQCQYLRINFLDDSFEYPPNLITLRINNYLNPLSEIPALFKVLTCGDNDKSKNHIQRYPSTLKTIKYHQFTLRCIDKENYIIFDKSTFKCGYYTHKINN